MKFNGGPGGDKKITSHPTGVRGLKCCRTVCAYATMWVAPHWGAWIEIVCSAFVSFSDVSHPTGVRGLKYHARTRVLAHGRRTPLGCVD